MFYKAQVREIKPGTLVQFDGSCTCLPKDAYRLVVSDEEGELFVECECGRHYLNGQMDLETHEEYIGFQKVTPCD